MSEKSTSEKKKGGEIPQVLEKKVEELVAYSKRNINRGARQILRDIEITRRDFMSLLLITIGITILTEISAYYSGYLIDKDVLFGGALLGGSVLAGIFWASIIVDRIEKKFPIIVAAFVLSPMITVLGVLFKDSIYTFIPIVLFAMNIIICTNLVIIMLVLIIQYTSILERGRIIAIISLFNIVVAILIWFFLINGYWGLLPAVFPLLIAFLLYKEQGLEKTFSRFLEESRKYAKEHHLIEEDKQYTKEWLNQVRETIKQKRTLKEYIQFLEKNSIFFKYLLVIFSIGVIVGMLIPMNEVAESILEKQTSIPGFILLLPIFIAIGAFLIGLIFDFYGRKATISMIIYMIGLTTFYNVFRSQSGADSNLSGLVTLIFVLFISIPLVNGDISRDEFMGRTTILFIIVAVLGIAAGIEIKAQLIFDLVARFEFLNPDLFNEASQIEGTLVYNFGITSIVFMMCLTALFILANIQTELSSDEQDWPEALIHLYLIHNSGLLIYEHSFREDNLLATADLVSGGLMGLISMLKEITKTSQNLRVLDHGDKKLFFQWDKDEQVVCVLVIQRELVIIRNKLAQFLIAFDQKYEKELKNFVGVREDAWEGMDELVQFYFSRKYMNWVPVIKEITKNLEDSKLDEEKEKPGETIGSVSLVKNVKS